MYQLCPSILAADFNRLGEQIQILEKNGVKILHIDVMDGVFVPSISFGMPLITSIRKESGMFFDCHVMAVEPERHIDALCDCGVDSLTVHIEACKILHETLKKIHDKGIKAGIAISPATPVELLDEYLEEIDSVTVMTVEPGFGAQKYITACTEKIRKLRAMIEEKGAAVDIRVDGGINKDTLDIVIEAGANHFVAGSAVFSNDIEANVVKFKEHLAKSLKK